MKKSIYIEWHFRGWQDDTDFGFYCNCRSFCLTLTRCLRGLLQKHIFSLFLLYTTFFIAGDALAQTPSVKASLSRDHVLIGEPVELKVEVRTRDNLPVTAWFTLPDSFHHLEILSRSPLDSVAESAFTTYHQTFTITGFDQGIWMIPALGIRFNSKMLYTDSLPLTIVPVQLKDSTYHDIREIIDVPGTKTPWWYWVAAIVSLLALGILIWLWLKAKAGKPIAADAHSNALPALEEALGRLRVLEAEQLPDKGEWKKYYSALTGIFKVYIDRRFNTAALQKTTDELLFLLNGMLDKQMVSETAEALRISDAVKFARYQPQKDSASASLHIVERVIRTLDHLKQ